MTNMKDMTNKILAATALVILAVACTQKAEQPLRYGTLAVNLSGEPVVDVVSKTPVTLEQESSEAANYMVRIYNSVNEKKYESPFNTFKPQVLPLGTYYVTAENCSATEAEVDNGKMRLYGRSSDVTLSLENLSQSATVDCVVVNGKVTVVYDASVNGRFSDLKVVLTSGDRSLTVNETATGVETETWFNPATVTYSISGTFDPSGVNQQVNVSKTIEVKERSNIKLLVKVNLNNGQLVPNVTFDTSIDDQVTESGEFNPYE